LHTSFSSKKFFKIILDNNAAVAYIGIQLKEAMMNMQGISTVRFNFWGYWYWRQHGHGGYCLDNLRQA